MDFEIYKTESSHPRTYIVFDVDHSKQCDRVKSSKRYFHSGAEHIFHKYCWIYRKKLYFLKPNEKATKAIAYFYR